MRKAGMHESPKVLIPKLPLPAHSCGQEAPATLQEQSVVESAPVPKVHKHGSQGHGPSWHGLSAVSRQQQNGRRGTRRTTPRNECSPAPGTEPERENMTGKWPHLAGVLGGQQHEHPVLQAEMKGL